MKKDKEALRDTLAQIVDIARKDGSAEDALEQIGQIASDALAGNFVEDRFIIIELDNGVLLYDFTGNLIDRTHALTEELREKNKSSIMMLPDIDLKETPQTLTELLKLVPTLPVSRYQDLAS